MDRKYTTVNSIETFIKYYDINNIYLDVDGVLIHSCQAVCDILNEDSSDYDAVWISNSIWLYMLDNSNLITDSKSIVTVPVVMGINKSKASELGFVDKDIYNKDILNAIK